MHLSLCLRQTCILELLAALHEAGTARLVRKVYAVWDQSFPQFLPGLH